MTLPIRPSPRTLVLLERHHANAESGARAIRSHARRVCAALNISTPSWALAAPKPPATPRPAPREPQDFTNIRHAAHEAAVARGDGAAAAVLRYRVRAAAARRRQDPPPWALKRIGT